jgi:TolB-like protein/AraC-like DNA-binding protein
MNRELLQKLTSMVESNLANESFGPVDLAREAGMSQSNLNRKLKSISSQTISQFIREVRLKKAKELLQNEDFTVAEISYRVGFGSPTYFNKCFHEYFGYAPGEQRNREPENDPGSDPEKQPPETHPTKTSRRKIWIGLTFSLIVVIPLTIILIHQVLNSKLDKSIAVLPFEFLGDETEKQYLADGMMVGISSNLSKIYDLRITPRTSMEQYRNTDKTARTIGKELAVDYLLDGSYLKEGDKGKLVLHLIKVKDDRQVWTNDYVFDNDVSYKIEKKAAEDVANLLKAKITHEEKQLIQKGQPTNFTAYEVYQRGKYDLNQYHEVGRKREDLERAQKLFSKALEYDSSFALSYAGLAEIYWCKFEWRTDMKDKYLDSAIMMANRALAYDDRCADAYLFRCLIYNELGKNEQALRDGEKAVKYNPNDSRAYNAVFRVDPNNNGDWIKVIQFSYERVKRFRGKELPDNLWWLGRNFIEFGFPEQAEKYYRQWVEITQDSAGYLFGMEWVCFSTEKFEEAFQYAQKFYNYTNRTDTTAMDLEILQYCNYSGHDREAYEYAKKYVDRCKRAGKTPGMLGRVAYAYWKVGKTEEARDFFKLEIENYLKQKELEGNQDEEGFNAAVAMDYAMLGEKEKAFQYIKYNNEAQIPLWALTLLRCDPAFNDIREDPRFQTVLKAYESQYQAKHDRLEEWLEENGML